VLVGVIGDNTIDEYTGVGERSFVGGNALNVAVHLRRLGTEASYWGAIGFDRNGDRVREALVSEGVRVEGLVRLPGNTSCTRIRTDNQGDRVFEFEDFGVCDEYRPTPGQLTALAQCAAVHIGMLRAPGWVRRALSSRGVLVTQDCAVSDGYADLGVAFCSAGEDQARARRLARDAVAGGARLAVVTCGADGSIAFNGRAWWAAPAVSTDVVDTTGAGDSYIAGFLVAILAGCSVGQAMRQGAENAARTCAHLGAWIQAPGAAE
jgi:fructoselysine 6-kinase